MLAALPDGRSTASAEIEANSRLILPPTLAIAARSAAVGAWLYPTSKCSRGGADVAADAPTISTKTPTASAARNAFKCLSPLSDIWTPVDLVRPARGMVAPKTRFVYLSWIAR